MSDVWETPVPTLETSSSLRNTCWAMDQDCGSPLEKLLLLRIADMCGGSAMTRFRVAEMAKFACAPEADVTEALLSLEQWSLLHSVEEGEVYTVAMPWWRPGRSTSARVGGGSERRLQHKATVRNTLMELQCCRCWYCGGDLLGDRTPHVEHQIPLSRGGADAIENLVMACGPCNIEKGAKTVDEYRAYLASRRRELVFFSGEGFSS